jgi:hypothetical protein
MRRVQKIILITVTALFFCIMGHTSLTMAEEKVSGDERAYLLAE